MLENVIFFSKNCITRQQLKHQPNLKLCSVLPT